MIWLTWRQFRVPAGVVFAALVVLAAGLALTGPRLAHDWNTGIAACTSTDDCRIYAQEFFADYEMVFLGLSGIVLLVPALLGLFWGAPLIARELEAGTHRLVWSQSVTRARWLAVKLGITGLAAMLAAGLAGWMVDWWSGPIDEAAADQIARMSPLLFDVRGIVPIGYASFAFVLGVTVGMLVRRPLPAMAITLAVFAGVQIAMPALVRPHLLPPTRTTTVITLDNLGGLMAKGPDRPFEVTVELSDTGAWVLANETIDRSGRVVQTVPVYPDRGPCARGEGGGPPASCIAEINRLGYRQRVVYHSSDRFWTFQWIETGIYLVLGLGLAGICFYRIRRNLS